jgi:type IV pilus secretin PilQ/predicted competence protein
MRLAGLSARLLPAAFVAGLGSLVLAAGEAPVRLIGVSATTDARNHAVLIQASEPVAYSVSRPDPETILVELRDVQVTGATSRLGNSTLVRQVTFEDDIALDGNQVGRIRVSLARPATHTVRSDRGTIRLDLVPSANADRAAATAVRRPQPGTTRGASVLQSVTTSVEAGRTTIVLRGNGMLGPASLTEAEDLPPRLVMDFPGVTFTAAPQTVVGGTVHRVRVGMNQRTPPVTRVVIDLETPAPFEAQRVGPDGRDFAVVVEDPGLRRDAPIAEQDASGSGVPGSAPAEEEEDDELIGELVDGPVPVFSDLTTAAGTAAIDPMSALRLANAATPQASEPAATPAQPAEPQTPAPAPTPTLQGSSFQQDSSQERRYTGHPISMDFQNADLRSVLRTFAEISGLNMVIDPQVQGSVDIVLTDVPWDQALDTILRANNLGYTVDGTIVRIAQLQTLQAEQEQRKRLQQAQADAGQLMVRTWALSYAKAADVQPLLTRSALSTRGQIQVDTRTNTLILTDLPERLDTAANLITILDRAEPQVEVEARVVQTTREFAKAIGIQWGFGGRMSPELGNTLPLSFPNRVIAGGRSGTQGPTDPRSLPSDQVPTNVSMPVTGEGTSTIGVQLGAVNGAFNLDVALSALERSGKGRVLSTPRLTTQNNIEAEVAQGVQIPIQTVANNTVTVSFKDAVLLLKVTPQITSANTVIMRITIENASPDFSRSVNNIPPIDTQRAITQVQVNDGATTVIGGIFVSREQSSHNRTPLLHRIPLLGWLFRRDSINDESRELLIFITPRILRG